MNAARFLKTSLVALFIKHGAQVNATNKSGETALMLAVSQATHFSAPKRQGIATIKLLLNSGADAKIADKNGFTRIAQNAPLLAAGMDEGTFDRLDAG